MSSIHNGATPVRLKAARVLFRSGAKVEVLTDAHLQIPKVAQEVVVEDLKLRSAAAHGMGTPVEADGESVLVASPPATELPTEEVVVAMVGAILKRLHHDGVEAPRIGAGTARSKACEECHDREDPSPTHEAASAFPTGTALIIPACMW